MDESTPDSPDSSDSQGSGEGDHILCASVESVSVAGTAPAVGDTVSAKIEGTVDRVEGERVYLKVDKVNGQDVPDDSTDKAEPQNDESALLDQAKTADSYA